MNKIFAIYFIVITLIIIYATKINISIQDITNYIRRRLLREKYIFFYLVIIFITLTCFKLFYFSQSTSLINNELLAPALLSKSGEYVLSKTTSEESQRVIVDALRKLSTINLSEEFIINKFELNNLIYLYYSDPKLGISSWIQENKILVDPNSLWRGRVIHHYSTILFPLREIKNGDWSYLLTSQYGLASLLPLFFVQHSSFLSYGVIGLLVLLISGIYLLHKTKNSISNILIVGGLLISAILLTNIGAIRINPGFTFLRYIPIALLLFQFYKSLDPKNNINIYIIFLLSLFNTIQFNILFLLIVISTYILLALDREKIPQSRMIKILIPALAIFTFQFILFSYQKNSFTPSLFSSISEPKISLFYTISILISPLIFLAIYIIKYKRLVTVGEINHVQIIFACISYGFCSSYAIGFAKSSQHYAGFIFMAFIPIFIFVKASVKSRLLLFTTISLLLFPAVRFKYFNFGNKYSASYSSLYSYQNDIGTTLKFKTALNLDEVFKSYNAITERYIRDGKIYFISKDKIFIELYINKNIEPKVYDIFTNFIDITPNNAVSKLKKDGAEYLVLDNTKLMEYSKELAKISGGIVENQEQLNNIKIINNIQGLANLIESKRLECNARYCIYKI